MELNFGAVVFPAGTVLEALTVLLGQVRGDFDQGSALRLGRHARDAIEHIATLEDDGGHEPREGSHARTFSETMNPARTTSTEQTPQSRARGSKLEIGL
jgi:hypothetical protein